MPSSPPPAPDQRPSNGALAGQRAFVTGASGFIGSHLAARLLAEGAEVHVLLRRGGDQERLAPLRSLLHVHAGDVTEPASVHAAMKAAAPDVVFHLAADTGVRRLTEGWAGVERSVRVNVEGTLTVLRAALEATHPVASFVRAGGLEEYGTGDTPYDERQREAPISPYSASQVAATHYCEMLQRGTSTRIVTLRPALVYGPGQSTDFFIPGLIRSCLRGADFDMTAGTQHRDLLYIDDLIDAFVPAATRDGVSGVINVGHGMEHAVRDVAELIVRTCGTGAKLRLGAVATRTGDLEHLVTSTARAEALLGWHASTSLPDGIRRTVEWYRANSDSAGSERRSERSHEQVRS